MNQRRSSSRTARRVTFLGVIGLTALLSGAPACHDFDSSRELPPRASVGQEMYGVLCDRVAAQALREDLTGASFRNVCHQPIGGQFSDQVDRSLLTPLTADAVDVNGQPVTAEKQKADRDRSIGKIEAMARRRQDLIRALDATFPAGDKIAIKDLAASDPASTCDPAKAGQGLLTDELSNMLGRMGPLYTDGTLPQSTESLARVVDVFQKDANAQQAWQRISARQGYRPITTALGVARPVVAYPNLRDFANASLRLLSADSNPYDLKPRFDAQGRRIPIAGPGNAAFNKMLEVAHNEFLDATPDDKLAALVETQDPTGRVVISRPRDNIEMLQKVMFTSDDTFSNGPSKWVVRRDSRGYARIRDGEVPAPFVDADSDGLPDVDDVGNFKTSNGSLAPSPFAFPGSPTTFSRDPDGRATVGDGLIYDYLDTSKTFAAQMMKDMRPLVNSDPAANHETLMDMMGGLPIMMGPRETRSKKYNNGATVQFQGIKVDQSPLLDFVYALGVILGDQTSDLTLSMTQQLFTTQAPSMARVTGAINTAYDIAQKHTESAIPRQSVFWDENLDIMAELVKEPGLLEDILHAFADPASADLGNVFSKFANFKDDMSYDRSNLNGPAMNRTTNSVSDPKTPVDRTKPITGANRSALMRFLKVVNDTLGVAACNKQDATLNVDVPVIGSTHLGIIKFDECAVFKIPDLATFYVDSIGDAWNNGPQTSPRPGTIFMRGKALGISLSSITTPSLIQQSAGITGMYDTSSGLGADLAPTPAFLNRLVFFDLKNDTTNTQSAKFISDLQGDFMGTAACPERIIDDPVPDADDAIKSGPDQGKIRGLRNCADGQWLQQRDADALYPLESFGFYDAIKPLVSAFVRHGREDLFVKMSAAIYRSFPGPDATVEECKLPGGGDCPRDNMVSYEPIVTEAFAGDIFPALGALVKTLDTMAIKSCKTAVDANGVCPADSIELLSGIDVMAATTRAIVDPARAQAKGLKDRLGNVGTKRNDGTPVAQVTPAYLLTNALLGVDVAFDTYEQQNPQDKDRRVGWRRARSQLVDQFLGVNGIKDNSAFANPSIATMTPVLMDTLRSQLWAHCPNSFAAPLDDGVAHPACTWATQDLVQKASDTLAGPLATSGIDVMDAIRTDADGRHETEKMMEYLLDSASNNDALASMLASSNDVLQILRDDENLIPLLRIAAAAVDATVYDDQGMIKQKSLIDANMALLARMNGKYLDETGKEICKKEIDANQVLTAVLQRVVTPINDGDFKGDTPLEVIIDVIADVNRVDPTQPYDGTLRQDDYSNMSKNVTEFLIDPQNGLEQFYEVVRNGLK